MRRQTRARERDAQRPAAGSGQKAIHYGSCRRTNVREENSRYRFCTRTPERERERELYIAIYNVFTLLPPWRGRTCWQSSAGGDSSPGFIVNSLRRVKGREERRRGISLFTRNSHREGERKSFYWLLKFRLGDFGERRPSVYLWDIRERGSCARSFGNNCVWELGLCAVLCRVCYLQMVLRSCGFASSRAWIWKLLFWRLEKSAG